MKCVYENGKVFVHQTHKEFLQNCSTEELARFIVGVYLHDSPMPLIKGLEQGYKNACAAESIVNAFNWLQESE